MLLHVGREHPLGAVFLVVRSAVEYALEILQRKFGIDGRERAAQLDDGVHSLAAPEGVLGREVAGRKDLAEQVAEALVSLLHRLRALFEPVVHVAEQLPELLMEELRAAVDRLRQLAAELVDLLLDENQRLVFLFFSEESLQAMQQNPSESGKTTKQQQDDQSRIQRFHGSTLCR